MDFFSSGKFGKKVVFLGDNIGKFTYISAGFKGTFNLYTFCFLFIHFSFEIVQKILIFVKLYPR